MFDVNAALIRVRANRPSTVEVTVPQDLQDRLVKAVKTLGYKISYSGYTEGSTSYAVAFPVDSKLKSKDLENKLRDALGNYGGYMNVDLMK